MARRVLRGGREHADMGGAICSVAAGHGRNWGTGSVTGCYGSLILGLKQIQSKMVTEVEFETGSVPDGLLSLVRPMPGRPNPEVTFYNAGQTQLSFRWRRAQSEWQAVDLPPRTAI